MENNEENHNKNKRWADDVLDRDRIASFLTKSLTEQARAIKKSGPAGLTVALDADWGTGKTFFIEHWAADLRDLGHPVIIFDAWQNDIGDEAAIALMACIKGEMEKWTNKIPKKELIRQKAIEATRDAVKGLRRAIVPASKVVAKGLLKKTTGIAFEELTSAFDEDESSNNIDSAMKGASEALEAGLDELFKQALEDHNKRSIAISTFKSSIEKLIGLLETGAAAQAPLFVFVDEVDRCRPTYAIKLLEEIKHIFGIPKICFVVSTNLRQLSESVCAIYGHGFDSHRYLKRFFDHQYTLPSPNNRNFTNLLFSEYTLIDSRESVSGLPSSSKSARTKQFAASLISDAFNLDLRSQRQVYSIANSVVAAIPKEKKIFIMWLFFLCALRHKEPALFETLLDKNLGQIDFNEICKKSFYRDPEIEHDLMPDMNRRLPQTRKTKISEIIYLYHDWSFSDLEELGNKVSRINRYDYPASNLFPITNEMPNTYDPGKRYKPSIANYAEWVKYAGISLEDL